MEKNKKMKRRSIIGTIAILIVVCVAFCVEGCGKKEQNPGETAEPPKPKPLNISILIDLSDRITKAPNNIPQDKIDIELIEHIVEQMKEKTVRSRMLCDDRLRVLFFPTPDLEDISGILKELQINMHCENRKEIAPLKQKLLQIDSVFCTNLNLIYQKSLEKGEFKGADIWGFFQNKVEDLCIDDDCRNILIILTDGYIYHQDHKVVKDGRCSWVLENMLRQNPDLRLLNPFPEEKKIENLEVLMLEVDSGDPKLENSLKTLLSQWLNDMGIEKNKIISTTTPNETTLFIDKFIDWKEK